jgi:hypothetical protein
MTTELVKPTSTATKPATRADTESEPNIGQSISGARGGHRLGADSPAIAARSLQSQRCRKPTNLS